MARQTLRWASSPASWISIIERCRIEGELWRVRELQKWKYVLGQFLFRQLKRAFETHGIGHIKVARHKPPERDQMRATSDLLSELMDKTPHVGAFRAGDAEMARWFFIFGKTKSINVHELRLALYFDAFPCELVKWHVIFLHR